MKLECLKRFKSRKAEPNLFGKAKGIKQIVVLKGRSKAAFC
jgi:hypothetical protein